MAEFKFDEGDKAAIKTTVNVLVLLILFVTCNWIFDLNITIEDLKWWVPVIAVIVGMFYRLSVYLTMKYPPVGYILFGIKEKEEDG